MATALFCTAKKLICYNKKLKDQNNLTIFVEQIENFTFMTFNKQKINEITWISLKRIYKFSKLNKIMIFLKFKQKLSIV